jgi:hypothetical protein
VWPSGCAEGVTTSRQERMTTQLAADEVLAQLHISNGSSNSKSSSGAQ